MDSRNLPIGTLNEKRREAVRLRLSGIGLTEIKKQTGLSAPTIIAAHKAFLAEGWNGIAVRTAVAVRVKGEAFLLNRRPGYLR